MVVRRCHVCFIFEDERYPSDPVSLCQLKGRAKRPCMLCENEVDIEKIWPDADSGLQYTYWACVPCYATIRRDLIMYDSAGDVGCCGDKISKVTAKRRGETERSMMREQFRDSEGACFWQLRYRFQKSGQTKTHLAGSIVCRLCVYDGITLLSGDCSINCQQFIVQSGRVLGRLQQYCINVTAADLLGEETGNSRSGLRAALTLKVDKSYMK